MDHERFKDIAAGVQSVTFSLAVAIGGIWTATTFFMLHSSEEAIARTAMSMSTIIKTSQISASRTNYYGLAIDFVFENTGGQEINLDWADSPVTVTRVLMNDSEKLNSSKIFHAHSFLYPRADKLIEQFNQKVQVHSKKTLSFYAEVDSPGLYLIAFQSPVNGKVTKWASNRFFVVAAKTGKEESKDNALL